MSDSIHDASNSATSVGFALALALATAILRKMRMRTRAIVTCRARGVACTHEMTVRDSVPASREPVPH